MKIIVSKDAKALGAKVVLSDPVVTNGSYPVHLNQLKIATRAGVGTKQKSEGRSV